MDSKNNKNNKNSKNNRNLRGVLVLLAWAVVLTIGFNYFAAYTGNAANKATSFEVDFSAQADLVREDKIARVEFKNGQILATPIDGYVYTDESGKEPKTYTNSEKTKVTLYTTQINSNNFYDLLNRQDILDKEVYAIVHKQKPRKKAHTSRAKADRRGDCKSQASG